MDLNITNLKDPQQENVITLADKVFARPFREGLVHQVVTAYLAAARAGTRAQKTRAEVSGGGSKPWRQKGMGRARAGTIRSPIWRKGGVTFAAKPQDYSQKVNKKVYRAALCAILSELARQSRLLVVEDIVIETPKTKELVNRLKELQLTKVLIIVEDITENLYFASRNVIGVNLIDVRGVNPLDLVAAEKVLLTTPAIKQLEGMLS